MKKLYYLLLVSIIPLLGNAQDLFVVRSGTVNFTSDAPLELIKAESSEISGLLNIKDGSFAFRSSMNSFEGFNSSLQRTHFNSTYLKTNEFPHTIFDGKIIEEIDFSVPGKYTVRGKGRFTCHGVEQERIIKCLINVTQSNIEVTAQFTVFLDDHNITIPSVVNQKIAEEILVDVSLILTEK